MGQQDRDYWRERYTERERTRNPQKVGSSDPTHWREDELDSTRPPQKQHTTNRGKLGPFLAAFPFWVLLVFGLYYAYKYLEQPRNAPSWLRLPSLQRPAVQKPPVSLEVERLYLESQRLELERQRLELEKRRLILESQAAQQPRISQF